MLVNSEQKSKASSPIEVTLNSIPEIVAIDGITISVGTVGFVSQTTSHFAGSTLVTVNFNEYPS